MNESLEISIYLCDQLTDLLEQDYQEIHKSLRGDIYDEYKLMLLDEIERIADLKRKLRRISQFM